MPCKTSQNDLEPACFYLRKSREDQEAEARGEGETLAKHKKALIRLANDYGVTITKIFEEIISGESLIHRPEMLELLKEVERGKWNSVFCMDIDRLGRGGMQEQGLIIETFKKANTKIVTPRKMYDLNDEFDEEYTEFEAFMARKELKIITRRLQGGRLRSIEDGNYLGTLPPYGYLIVKKDRKRYLVKNPEQTAPTELIWHLYREGMGTNKIADTLNRLGYVSYTGKKWPASSVLFILKNPVYAGITVWKKKEIKKSTTPGKKKDVHTRPRSEQIWIPNTHEGYVTEEEFAKVQDMLAGKYHSPYQLVNGLRNPLAGLIKCGLCGMSMIYRPYANQKAHFICYNKQCHNKSSRFEYVEKAVLNGLKLWLRQYRAQWDSLPQWEKTSDMIRIKEKALINLQRRLSELEKQKDRLHELLEKGIYDESTYLERAEKLTEQSSDAKTALSEMEDVLAAEIIRDSTRKNIVPRLENVLDIYEKTSDPVAKNKMLKSVLAHATYRKEQDQRGDAFSLVLYPKLPK